MKRKVISIISVFAVILFFAFSINVMADSGSFTYQGSAKYRCGSICNYGWAGDGTTLYARANPSSGNSGTRLYIYDDYYGNTNNYTSGTYPLSVNNPNEIQRSFPYGLWRYIFVEPISAGQNISGTVTYHF